MKLLPLIFIWLKFGFVYIAVFGLYECVDVLIVVVVVGIWGILYVWVVVDGIWSENLYTL